MGLNASQRLGVIVIALAAGPIACGDRPQPTELAPVVARVEVTPGVDTLSALGQTRTFSAVAQDVGGRPIPGKSFAWSSSALAVAPVDPATGIVTAVANGDAVIRATVDGITGQANIAVVQQVATVVVTPGTAALDAIAATQQFTAAAKDALGNTVPGVTFLWVSSNHNVATIDTGGLATAVGRGSAAISAVGRGIPGSSSLGVAQTVTHLAFSVAPTDAVAGVAISPSVQVEIRDAKGTLATGARDAVTLALSPSTGALAGTTTVHAVGGIATFTGLSIPRAGAGYTLAASSGTLTGATSVAFAVTAGAPAKVVVGGPSLVEVNRVIEPAVQVALFDAFDNTLSSGPVTLSLGTNPGGALLAGTLTADAVNGVATFRDLELDRTGSGYTLEARAAGGVRGQSPFFDVFAWTAVTAGANHSCGIITPGGAALCWGSNTVGQLGDGTVASRPVPAPVAGRLRFALVSAGERHTCGLTEAGLAYCWGYNAVGQLGDGGSAKTGTPVPVAGGLRFTSVSAGGAHTCGVTLAEEAYCWGDHFGKVPMLVKLLDGRGIQMAFAEVTAGELHSCGLAIGDPRESGVQCWGGDYGPAPKRILTSSPLGFHAVLMSAGGAHTCGLVGNDATCWGDNGNGQLGNAGAPVERDLPVRVVDPVTQLPPFLVDAVSAGRSHTCAMRFTTGYCWGRNAAGQLGDGTLAGKKVPVLVAGGLRFTAIRAGWEHTCGVTTAGAAYCWGANTTGQLGDGTVRGANEPVRVVKP